VKSSFYGQRRRTAPVQPSCRTGTEFEGRERVVHDPFARGQRMAATCASPSSLEGGDPLGPVERVTNRQISSTG